LIAWAAFTLGGASSARAGSPDAGAAPEIIPAPPDPAACWRAAAPELATRALEKFLPAPTVTGDDLPEDLRAFLAGAAAFGEGRHERALKDFGRALQVPASPLHHLARLVEPELRLRAGDAKGAAQAARAVLERYPALPYRASILGLLAAAEGSRGRARSAARALSRLSTARVPPARLAALTACLPQGTELPPTTRAPVTLEAARAAFELGHWEETIEHFQALLTRGKPGPGLRREALDSMGRSAFRLGRLEDAHRHYLTLWERFKRRSGLSWAIKTAFMTGDDVKGLKLVEVALKTTWDKQGTRRRMSEYLARYGYYERALKRYQEYLEGIPERSRWTATRAWTLGWLLFRTGAHPEAQARFEQALAKTAGDDARLRIQYWVARLAAVTGDVARAEAGYAEVAAGESAYYALLARSRLKDVQYARVLPLQGAPVLDRLFERASPVAPRARPQELAAVEPEHGFITSEALALAPDLPEVRAARALLKAGAVRLARDYVRLLARKSLLLRLRGVGRAELIGAPVLPGTDYRGWTTGYWGEALKRRVSKQRNRALWRAEQRAYARIQARGKALEAELVPFYALTHDQGMVRRHLRAWVELTGAEETAAAISWDKVLYPLAYAEVVLEAAAREEIDPFLIWSVMYQESRFDERVVSPSGAYGLMQVMPETGERLARMLGEASGEDAFDPLRLFEPRVNVRYGAHYLKALLQRFRGQEPMAIAAYNAGPIYVAAWVKRKGRLPLDVFVEEIPFDENRAYVKRVLSAWVRLRELYAGEADLFMPNRVDPVVETGVMF
jgi:soluble lytic murein transglycosylase-like protein